MHPQPDPEWYLYRAGARPVRLLTDDGRADPALRCSAQADLAALAEAIHALGSRLSEHELQQAERFLVVQRGRR